MATSDAPAGGQNPAAVSEASPRQITDKPSNTHAKPTQAVIIGPDIEAIRVSDTTSPRRVMT